MAANRIPSAEELEAALEDIKRIREVIQETRQRNPIQILMGPMFMLGLSFAPLFILAGIAGQLIYQTPGPDVWGYPKSWAIGALIGLVIVTSSLIKVSRARTVSKQHGYQYWAIWKQLFTTGYPRIAFPIIVMMVVTSIYLYQLGQGHQIIGIIGMASGCILLAAPLALPLPETRNLGIAFLTSSALSLFVLPTYPFYKMSVIWGLGCLWMAWIAMRGSERTE
jgi:hypothetical protein